MQISGQSHPMAALRAAELQQWAAGGEYRTILAGDDPRRGEDPDAANRVRDWWQSQGRPPA